MSAFPQLIHGRVVSNKTTIDPNPSEEALAWWNHHTDNQKADIILKHHPECLKRSELFCFSMFMSYNRDPQQLFDKENIDV